MVAIGAGLAGGITAVFCLIKQDNNNAIGVCIQLIKAINQNRELLNSLRDFLTVHARMGIV